MDLEVFYISAIPFYRNFRPLFPLREPDSENHSGRTHKSHRRDVFAKYQKRCNKSCYSIEIYIVGRAYHSQMAHYGIPQSEVKQSIDATSPRNRILKNTVGTNNCSKQKLTGWKNGTHTAMESSP